MSVIRNKKLKKMYEEFERSGYKITTDSTFHNTQDHITPSLKWQLEKLYPKIQKRDKTVIDKLLYLIERHPKNPQLKNYLSAAYTSSGNFKKGTEVNEWILKEHPHYLFGLLNKAHQMIDDGKPEMVPGILGKDMELKSLYPDRDLFHLAEVTGFFKLAIMYFAAIGDLEQAETRLQILEEIAPEHPDTESARRHLMPKRLEAGFKRFEDEEKTKIKVRAKGNYQSLQTTEKPVFNHPETEWLYQYDTNIEKEKLETILSLPRKTLVEDLVTILKDIILRYEYFRELEEAGKLKEEECFFACHAVYLLGELEADQVLDAILETFRQDSDFLQFWYFDLLTEDFWETLLKTGKNQLDKLQDFVLTPDLDTYARGEVVGSVSQLALHYPERRKEVIGWFDAVMGTVISANPDSGIIDSDFNGFLVWEAVELQGVELMDKIEQLYESGYVTEGIAGSFEDIKKDIDRKPEYEHKKEFTPIFEKYEELNRFKSSKNSKETVFPRYDEPIRATPKPGAPTPKTGRNDPCPCGSGKKYKKCCRNK
tara:strand:+ start:6449 stop:8065 length:1617 start_codon:yes stop_codon:yes gene_type:complete